MCEGSVSGPMGPPYIQGSAGLYVGASITGIGYSGGGGGFFIMISV